MVRYARSTLVSGLVSFYVSRARSAAAHDPRPRLFYHSCTCERAFYHQHVRAVFGGAEPVPPLKDDGVILMSEGFIWSE